MKRSQQVQKPPADCEHGSIGQMTHTNLNSDAQEAGAHLSGRKQTFLRKRTP